MTAPAAIQFRETDLDALAGFAGRIAVFVPEAGTLNAAGPPAQPADARRAGAFRRERRRSRR